jgi:hypothetical protein
VKARAARHDLARQGSPDRTIGRNVLISGASLMRKTCAATMAAAAATAAALTLPAAAPAATVTITGDDGNPVALSPAAPVSLRQMKTEVGVTRTGAETRYTVTTTGPAGAASSPVDCFTIPTTTRMNYQGNGTYTVTVATYTSKTGCTGTPTTTSYQVVIGAGVALAQPAGKLLTRRPNEVGAIEHQLPITLNPGALTDEIRYARGGVLGADGAISGPSQQAFVDPATGAVKLRLDAPGDYVVVARAQAFSQAFTPWSAPVRFRAVAPFDFVSAPSCVDCRGPRYKLRGQLREKSARGKVTVKIARGKKGGKFRSVGKARVRRGVFKKKLTINSPGVYRARYIYKGSATIAPGKVTTQFRITRRFF